MNFFSNSFQLFPENYVKIIQDKNKFINLIINLVRPVLVLSFAAGHIPFPNSFRQRLVDPDKRNIILSSRAEGDHGTMQGCGSALL